MSPKLYCASASPWSAACLTVSRSSCAESTMMARPPATSTAVAMRISLDILFIGFKCGLFSSLQALAYPSQDARRIPGVMNAAWLATPSVRVNPSSQRASKGIDFSGSSWEFPTLEWRTPLRNSSPQRQLESLSPRSTTISFVCFLRPGPVDSRLPSRRITPLTST